MNREHVIKSQVVTSLLYGLYNKFFLIFILLPDSHFPKLCCSAFSLLSIFYCCHHEVARSRQPFLLFSRWVSLTLCSGHNPKCLWQFQAVMVSQLTSVVQQLTNWPLLMSIPQSDLVTFSSPSYSFRLCCALKVFAFNAPGAFLVFHVSLNSNIILNPSGTMILYLTSLLWNQSKTKVRQVYQCLPQSVTSTNARVNNCFAIMT